jgi:hypothetical protein
VNAPIVVEDHSGSATEWVVSFDGPNPRKEYAVRVYTKAEAEQLVTLYSTLLTNAAIQVLDSAFRLDPGAIYSLVNNRVPCNQSLGDHPTIPIQSTPVANQRVLTVGLLGVLNGILESTGACKVSSVIDNDGALLGFTWYKDPKKGPDEEDDEQDDDDWPNAHGRRLDENLKAH